MKRILVSSDDFPMLTSVKCPICSAPVVIEEIDEWEMETGRVTTGGFHINCSTEPNIESDDWEDWFNSHWSMPYVDWMPLEMKMLKAFNQKFRYTSGP